MLYIHNRKVTSCDAPSIRRQVGRSFEQDSRTANIIDWYIEDSSEHRFFSIKEFVQKIMDYLTTDHLPIQCTHFSHPGPYIIQMSGSREEDARRANIKAKLDRTPDGYTWHHSEGVTCSGNTITCKMYLIDSDYHRLRHSGGVKEYEALTGALYS